MRVNKVEWNKKTNLPKGVRLRMKQDKPRYVIQKCGNYLGTYNTIPECIEVLLSYDKKVGEYKKLKNQKKQSPKNLSPSQLRKKRWEHVLPMIVEMVEKMSDEAGYFLSSREKFYNLMEDKVLNKITHNYWYHKIKRDYFAFKYKNQS